ncbi:Elongation factor 1-beta [Phlyctochytrium bullatum]|nr:Elongation factor 1-beta [Phlyctochytrium bullatum]
MEKILFHGTPNENVESICRNNLSMAKKGANDDGYFGSGLYFSDKVDYTTPYTRSPATPVGVGATGKVIVFKVLLGKTQHLSETQNMMGAELLPGIDSYVSPKEFEYVIFNSAQCMPTHVIEWVAEKAASEIIGIEGELPGGVKYK